MSEVPLYWRYSRKRPGILRQVVRPPRISRLLARARSCNKKANVLPPRTPPPVGSFRTGVPDLRENAPPEDPTVGLCLGSYGGPGGVGVFLWAKYPCTPIPRRLGPS